jgi:hypothetical protein
MPRERPRIGEWNEEEAFAAFEGHIKNKDISKEDLLRLRPWHNTPWHEKPHKCKVSVGDAAPDTKLVNLDGSDTSVRKVVEGNKPVVMVFGSITCPPFRSMFLKEIDEIVGEQKGKVKLVVVYLAEAHPKDGWHLGVNDKQEVEITAHSTIEDRIASAKKLKEMYPHIKELVVDSIDNDTDNMYEAQSSRIYVIHDKKIIYQSHVGPFQISPSSLQTFLWEWPVVAEES